MEVADGEGIQSEILRFAQNDSACMFLPFADFFTPSSAWASVDRPLGAVACRGRACPTRCCRRCNVPLSILDNNCVVMVSY